jgi:hypothetical protein
MPALLAELHREVLIGDREVHYALPLLVEDLIVLDVVECLLELGDCSRYELEREFVLGAEHRGDVELCEPYVPGDDMSKSRVLLSDQVRVL